MANDFWAHKQVLVTGATGFVGNHLFHYLKQRGAAVVGITRTAHKKNGFVVCDVCDYNRLAAIFSQKKFYACFHLASDSLVEEGQEIPYQTFKNNIVSALNILELGRTHKLKRIIVASSVHVYGKAQGPTLEDAPPKPSRPYETSKACVDIIAQSYADTFALPVLIPRFVNIYGPGDLNFTRIVPKTMRNIIAGNSPTLWHGASAREYLYIDDVVRAYDKLAKIADGQIEKNRVFNFGSYTAVSALELIRLILTLSGQMLSIKKTPAPRAHESVVGRVNWNKAKRILGWKPTTPLSKGLKATLDFYLSHQTHHD